MYKTIDEKEIPKLGLSENKRNVSLDIIRSLAIIAVVMTHVSAPLIYESNVSEYMFCWGNIFDSVSRIGVPLFVMLSGALLLNEDKKLSTKNILTNKVPRLVMVLVFWSAVYSALNNVIIPGVRGTSINLRLFIRSFVMGENFLWYLYMLIGVYLALPLLRAFVCKKNKNLVLYYIAISLSANFLIPVVKIASLKFGFLSEFSTFVDKFYLGYFNTFITYFLSGWYITNVGVPQKKIRKFLYLCAIASVFEIIMSCYITRDYGSSYANESIFVFLYSVGVYLALNNSTENYKDKTKRFFYFISKISFGIYVVHMLIFDKVERLCGIVGLYKTNAPIYIVVVFIIIFVLSALITMIISKIPVLKKTVMF